MTQTREDLLQTITELQSRLNEIQDRAEAAEDALRAIQSGEVDALVISDQIYTLESADQAYRVMVEKVQEGVATLQPDGMVLYANQRLADMLHSPLEKLLGTNLIPWVPPDDRKLFSGLLKGAQIGASKGELIFRRPDGSALPVLLSITGIENQGQRVLCLVATDLTEQKRQEEILAAERLARSILDQASEAILVCDLQGRVIRASQAVYDLISQNPLYQAFEWSFPLAIVGNGQPGERFSIETVLQGHIFRSCEVRLAAEKSTASDQERDTYLLLSATPLRNERDEILGCTVALTDITSRKRAELELHRAKRIAEENQAVLETVIQQMPAGIIVTDATGSQARNNTAMDRIWRRSMLPDENVREHDYRAFHPDGREYELDEWPLTRSLKKGEIVLDEEMTILRGDGTLGTVQASSAPIQDKQGNLIAGVVIDTDITERKLVEAQVRAEKEWFHTTLASIGDAVITTDVDGNLTFMNPIAEQLSGWKNAEATGLPMDQVLQIINEQTHKPAVNPVRRVLEEDRIVGLANHSALVRRDGRIILIEDSAAPIRGSDGGMLGVVMVFHDVTDTRRKEEELVRLNRTLLALGHSSQAMLHLEDEAAYLNEVCRIITEDCGHAMAWIGFAEDDEAKSVRPAAYAGFEAGYLETLQITWADSESGRGPTGTAIRTGQVSLCRNMLTDPVFEPWRDRALKRGYASSIVLPLMDGRRALGALTIYSREPDPFSENEISLLTELANDLVYGILTLRARASQEQARQTQLENEQNRARVEVQRRLLEQREQERLQIARDLHDGPVQELTAATFTVQSLALGWQNAEARDQYADLLGMIGKTIADLRDYAGELRPPSLMKFGLGKAILSYADEFHAKHPELRIEVEKAEEEHLSPEARIGLFRIFQESLNNIHKHARATSVRVRFEVNSENVVLEIQDNGAGFQIPGDWLELARAGHLGLVGMRERAEALGGQLEIESGTGEGSCVRVTIPVQRDP